MPITSSVNDTCVPQHGRRTMSRHSDRLNWAWSWCLAMLNTRATGAVDDESCTRGAVVIWRCSESLPQPHVIERVFCKLRAHGMSKSWLSWVDEFDSGRRRRRPSWRGHIAYKALCALLLRRSGKSATQPTFSNVGHTRRGSISTRTAKLKWETKVRGSDDPAVRFRKFGRVGAPCAGCWCGTGKKGENRG